MAETLSIHHTRIHLAAVGPVGASIGLRSEAGLAPAGQARTLATADSPCLEITVRLRPAVLFAALVLATATATALWTCPIPKWATSPWTSSPCWDV